MKTKILSPWMKCKLLLVVSLAALAVVILAGCNAFKKESVKTQLSEVLQLAYDNGGSQAVSNKISELVAEGKLTGEQAVRLQALADIAFEKLIEDLANGEGLLNTDATGNAGSSDGCTTSAPGDASVGGDAGNT